MIRATELKDYPVPSRINAFIIIVQLMSYAGLMVLVARDLNPWILAAAAAAFGLLFNSIYSVIHEAEHAMLFRNRTTNDAVGILMAALFPAPFHLIRQGHLGHHLRNRSDDEAFDLYFDGDNVLWRWLVWLHVLTGLFYLFVVLSIPATILFPGILNRRGGKAAHAIDRPGQAFLDSLNPRYLRAVRLESLGALLLHAGIISLMGQHWWHYLILYATGGFCWSAMQYVHHYETERHVTRGARNLWLFGPIDLLLLNHNWHRAHHEHPTIPWIYLGRLGQDRAPGIKGFLPYHYLRMWRGPRRTSEHVENKYAGRIIQ